MRRTRRRGLSLAILLLVMVAIAAVLGALAARVGSARSATRHEQAKVQARYDTTSAMNQVLALVRAGEDPATAARTVTRTTGVEVLVAGDRILVSGRGVALQAQLQPRAWKHVLFASILNLNGLRGAFRADDPHRPTRGTPPTVSETFHETTRARALFSGIVLAPQPADCRFQPGGGAWQATTVAGRQAFVYMGGGAGDALGWTAGTFRWTRDLNRWVATTGEELRFSNGTWTLLVPPGRTGRLAGTVLVDGASLQVRGSVSLQGQIVVWGGALQVPYGQLGIEAWPDTLALAALAGPATPTTTPWTMDRVPRPGDLIFNTGWSALRVGDVTRPEETGALVLAQSRLVKRGARLRIAGVVAAGRADLDGVPAGDLVWSGRVGRMTPDGFVSTDVGVSAPSKLDVR